MNETTYNVLLVEDSDADAKIIQSMLTAAPPKSFATESAKNLAQAIQRLSCGGIDVVILDLSLPDSQGLDTFLKIRNHVRDTPIVVVSGLGEESVAVESVKQGAQDYLVKDNLRRDLLQRALRYAIERHDLHRSLRSSEERFRQLTEHMSEVFWLLDHQGWRLLYVSSAYEKIWDRPRHGLYDHFDEWTNAIHPDDQARVAKALRGDMQRDQFAEQYRIVRPDGSIRWIWDRGVAIRNANGEIYRVAGVAADITEQRQLERDVMEASGREQQRISHDLHDSVGQELTGLGYMARSLAHKLADRDAPEAQLADEMFKATQQTLAEVRHAIRGLRPVELDANGLMVALEQLVQSVGQRVGLPCHFQCDIPVPVENNDAATHLYRIAQESINNAVKHAEANSILVRLETEGDRVILQICDDGVGMGESSNGASGIGLRSMRYRSNAIGASFDIRSKKDIGTVVTCTMKQDQVNEHE